MAGDERRGDGRGYVTRDQLRAMEERWRVRWRRIVPAIEFFEAMQELGLRELLPLVLSDARTRQVVGTLRSGRGRRVVWIGVVLGALSYAVTVAGSLLAIARTAGWIR